MCVVATVAYRVEMMTTLKIRKNCFSLKVPIQPCRPMSSPSWSHLTQFKRKQPNLKALPAHAGAHFSYWVQINAR